MPWFSTVNPVIVTMDIQNNGVVRCSDLSAECRKPKPIRK